MGPMAEPPEMLIKILLGFCVLLVMGFVGLVLLDIEKTWPFVLGFFASWLTGHLIFKAYEWHEERKMQKWADDFYARHPDNRDASKTAEDRIWADAERQKLDEIRKFSEELVAKQKAEEFARQTKPPYQNHPYLRHTSYNQKNVSVTQNSGSDITPIIVGAAAGYMAGSHAAHSSDSSCSSSDSSSSSSDSGSSGGE